MGRIVYVPPPHHSLGGSLRDVVDVVLLPCRDPSDALPRLLDVLGGTDTPVIVISPHRDTETVVNVFRGGATSYLVEGDYGTCSLSGVAMGATKGHTHFSPAACAALRDGARRMAPTLPEGDTEERTWTLLSPRERQIMELLSTGMGAQEIALRLSLTEKTIRNNLSNIYAKLDVRGGTEAVLRWLGAARGGSQRALAR
ncbi:LuxR C-terminal-related transcriptional regulator [Streptomyces sp. NPDC002845]